MIIDFEDGFAPEDKGPKRKVKGPLALSILVVVGALFLQNTLAANISLGSGSAIEFGQGVQVAAACSGSSTLTLTPYSSFINSSGSGSYYLNSVKVSGIPTSCYGADFQISAYDSVTSTALPIFNTSTRVATVYNNNGTFELGVGSSGMSITSGSGTFTVTFSSPVATAALVSRMTLQSGAHVPIPCVDGGTCVLGEVGPGGGNIFYVSNTGFDCGPTYSSTGSPTGGQCHYLEAAPKTWDGGTTDGRRSWADVASSTSVDVPGISNDSSVSLTNFGLGYKNSIALTTYNSSTVTAGPAARAYRGGSKSDWYLPASGELHQMIKWAKGLGASDSSVCGGTGTLNTLPAQGFIEDQYFSSSEYNATLAWSEHPAACGTSPREKDNAHLYLMRPIRAF
jgi:hypothetical protein